MKQFPNQNIYFIPIRLEDCTIPDECSEHTWVDIFEPNGTEKLIKSIKKEWKRRGFIWKKSSISSSGIFTGKYYYTVDSLGRVTIPEPLIEIIKSKYGGKIVITNELLDKCLMIYPYEEFLSLIKKIMSLPMEEPAFKLYTRRVIVPAVEVEWNETDDKLIIPPEFQKELRFKNNCDVVIAGQVNKIELWRKKDWDEAVSLSEVTEEDILIKLAEYGL